MRAMGRQRGDCRGRGKHARTWCKVDGRHTKGQEYEQCELCAQAARGAEADGIDALDRKGSRAMASLSGHGGALLRGRMRRRCRSVPEWQKGQGLPSSVYGQADSGSDGDDSAESTGCGRHSVSCSVRRSIRLAGAHSP